MYNSNMNGINMDAKYYEVECKDLIFRKPTEFEMPYMQETRKHAKISNNFGIWSFLVVAIFILVLIACMYDGSPEMKFTAIIMSFFFVASCIVSICFVGRKRAFEKKWDNQVLSGKVISKNIAWYYRRRLPFIQVVIDDTNIIVNTFCSVDTYDKAEFNTKVLVVRGSKNMVVTHIISDDQKPMW